MPYRFTWAITPATTAATALEPVWIGGTGRLPRKGGAPYPEDCALAGGAVVVGGDAPAAAAPDQHPGRAHHALARDSVLPRDGALVLLTLTAYPAGRLRLAQPRRIVRRRPARRPGRVHGRRSGPVERRRAGRRGDRSRMAGQAQLVSGRHRGPDDPATGAAGPILGLSTQAASDCSPRQIRSRTRMHSIRHHPASIRTQIRQFGRGATSHGSDQDAAHSGGSVRAVPGQGRLRSVKRSAPSL